MEVKNEIPFEGVIDGICNFIEKFFGKDEVAKLLLVAPRVWAPTILRKYGAKVADSAYISTPLKIHMMGRGLEGLTIGEKVHVGKDVFLDMMNPITIKNSAIVSMRTTIITHLHAADIPLVKTELPYQNGPVVIEEGAYIGCGTTILHGVTIGKNSIVGANSLVRKDIPEATLVAGVPAREIRKLKVSSN